MPLDARTILYITSGFSLNLKVFNCQFPGPPISISDKFNDHNKLSTSTFFSHGASGQNSVNYTI